VNPGLPAALLDALRDGQLKLIDLTYALDDQSPFWPDGRSASPFRAEATATHEHDGHSSRDLRLPEHFGTHLDAPRHFDARGKSVDQLSLPDLLLEAVVVDVSAAVRADPDYRLTVQDLLDWQAAHGFLPLGGALLVRTGWGSRWPSQKQYMNQDPQGIMHFPGLSLEAARYLVEHARPKAIGIDSASIDHGPSQDFEVHRLTMPAGIFHLENLTALEQLPATGAVLIALPMKLRGGSGGPTRVVAVVSARASGSPSCPLQRRVRN
jgi:kynurenine formamidase